MFDIASGARAEQWSRRAAAVRVSEPIPAGTIRVLKFGGSSLAAPDRIRGVAAIVLDAASRAPIVVVVSAFQGVTNQLIECARLAAGGKPFGAAFDAIADRHRSCLDALLPAGVGPVGPPIDEDLRELGATLRSISRDGSCPDAQLDAAASVGERLSARIVSAYLNQFQAAVFVDARRIVTTDDRFTQANILAAKTHRAVRSGVQRLWRRSPGAVPVITGFIGRTEDGRTTTIGRNGSDYTAAIVGAALDAAAIEIWTDVDGVMTADPNVVRNAAVLPEITYEDARVLSDCGAKVIHPRTIEPAVARSIPIVVKNSFNPSAPGTRIGRTAAAPAAGVASIDGVTLLTLSVIGPQETQAAVRLFDALAASGIRVVFASEAAIDRTISVGVQGRDLPAAVAAIDRAFAQEICAGTVTLDQRPDQALVAVVGDGSSAAARRPRGAGRTLALLSRHHIDVTAIASASRRTTFLVDAVDRARAVRVVHGDLVGAPATVAVVVVGVGRVGGALLGALHQRGAALRARGLDLAVVAVADSKRYVVARDGVDLGRWREALDASDRPIDLRALIGDVAAQFDAPHAALVDCTAAQSVVDAYPEFVDAGFHIVSPNKLANVQPWSRYESLRSLLAERRRLFYDSTNVGAGLPILATLRHLIAGGGTVSRIEGVVSGTLNYLFTAFDGAAPFSALVRDAHRLGLTEPDPRDDLGGQDAARKLLILARETGLPIDLGDVTVESLVPGALGGGPFSSDFFDAYAAHDGDMRARLECARRRGGVLRYVATLEDGRAHAGVRELPAHHPLASAHGCDNVVAITSDRSESTPLVVRGAGAGADVTARGLVADLSALATRLRE